jgi:CheY-like chemotaxis protein
LWVDDAPSNNTYPASTLRALGAKITQKLSTEAALQELEKNPNHTYNLIISDMGRGADYTAGLTLLKELRRRNFDILYIIFCSYQGEQKYKTDAMSLGAFAITSSTTTLFGDVTEVAKTLTA